MSINSALALITTNAQKISELENRMTSFEITTSTIEQTLAQQREIERILREKVEAKII